MKDGFKVVSNFLEENQITSMEKFVEHLPIFPPLIKKILAHKSEDFKLNKDDMERLFMYLCRNDEDLPRA